MRAQWNRNTLYFYNLWNKSQNREIIDAYVDKIPAADTDGADADTVGMKLLTFR